MANKVFAIAFIEIGIFFAANILMNPFKGQMVAQQIAIATLTFMFF